jgi:hypothetical protein
LPRINISRVNSRDILAPHRAIKQHDDGSPQHVSALCKRALALANEQIIGSRNAAIFGLRSARRGTDHDRKQQKKRELH